MCVLILVMGVLSLTRMVVDIFPAIDIPVVAVIWNYPGLSAQDMERRVVLISERAFSTTVNGIERIESQSIPGIGMLKVYFQPGAEIGAAIAQISSVSQHDPAHHAAGHAAAQRHPVQRVQRAGRAADGVERQPARAAGLRLRAELHPRAAVHDPRPGDAGAVRRQAAADQRRHRSARAGQQGAVAVRRRERAVDGQRDPAGGHGAHRRARVQRHPQQQPAQRRGVRAASRSRSSTARR